MSPVCALCTMANHSTRWQPATSQKVCTRSTYSCRFRPAFHDALSSSNPGEANTVIKRMILMLWQAILPDSFAQRVHTSVVICVSEQILVGRILHVLVIKGIYFISSSVCL